MRQYAAILSALFLLTGLGGWLLEGKAQGSGNPKAATGKKATESPNPSNKGSLIQTGGAQPGGSATGADVVSQRLSILRKKVLREEDFTESDESNRDPFRSYIDSWIERGPKINTNVMTAIFGKYSLEELSLIAVISGDANPRAMFRDPTGLGQTVKRGDYLSKSAARITKILSDRVVLELSEVTASGETKALERAVLVNPEGTEQ
jgi:Tfp pilus assembly protein PilP